MQKQMDQWKVKMTGVSAGTASEAPRRRLVRLSSLAVINQSYVGVCDGYAGNR